MKTKLILLLVAAIILAPLSNHSVAAVPGSETGVRMLSSTDEGVELLAELSLGDLNIDTTFVGGNQYSEITLKGWDRLEKPGEPNLPYMSALIAVPFGVEVSIDSVPGSYKVTKLLAPVMPGKAQVVSQNFDSMVSDPLDLDFDFITEPITKIYTSEAAYPQALVQITNEGVLRNQRLVSIAFFPVQYNPQRKTITVFESIIANIKFSPTALKVTSDNQVTDSPFDSYLSTALLNYDSAQSWRLQSSQQTAESLTNVTQVNLPWQPPTPTWRILTEGSGLFAIGYDDLSAAVVLLDDPNPKNFRLFRHGVELAIEVVGEDDGTFDAQDQILFYAPDLESKYTNFDVFWLTTGNTAGLRIANRPETPPTGDAVTAYTQENRYERNLYYRSLLKGTDSFERYVGEFMRAEGSLPVSISLPIATNLLTQGPAEINLRVVGWNFNDTLNPDHHLRVYLNENYIGEAYWDGNNWLELPLDVTGFLNEGNNILRLELPNDLGLVTEVIFVDWFTLSYPRFTRAQDNLLEFSYQEIGNRLFSLENFTTNDRSYLRIWDISNADNPVAVSDYEIFAQDADHYSLTFGDEILTEKSFLATDRRNSKGITSIELDTPNELLNPVSPPEMIVISHSDFMTEAERLAAYRGSVGTDTVAVDVQDIYDVFAYGLVDPLAIKSYLSHALENWNTQYALLFGDGHYDPKNYLGFGRSNYIPALLAFTDPWIGETAADNRYVTLVGDDLLPDMMLGRLTVNTPVEANRVVNKIISYELNSPGATWVDEILSIADDPDSAGNFPQIADDLFSELKPEYYLLEKVHYMVTHTDPIAARAAIVEQMNSGKVLVNYIGHGSYNIWADEPLFSRDQIGLLSNTERLSINLSMSCMDGFFHDPSYDLARFEGLAETVTRSTDAGAIASWSPTGQGIITGHDYLDRGFLTAYFNLGVATLGEATLAGKLKLWETGSNQDLLDTYTLFGDPALRIPRTFSAISDTYAVAEDETLNIPAVDGLLNNDLNPDGRTLTVELFVSASHGEVLLNNDGSFVYTPNPDFFGEDSFEYRLFDGSSYSNSATVSITVTAVNDPPVALDQLVWTLENTSMNIELQARDDGSGPYFLWSESNETREVSQVELNFSIVTQPMHGTLSGTPPYMTYTPSDGYLGTDWFTFKANDGQYDSNIATVDILVSLRNIFLPQIFR